MRYLHPQGSCVLACLARRLRLGGRGQGTIKMRVLGIVALGAALAGCASSGVQVSQEQAQVATTSAGVAVAVGARCATESTPLASTGDDWFS
jgi:hypothetical protein